MTLFSLSDINILKNSVLYYYLMLRKENLTGGPSTGSPWSKGGRCRSLSGLKHNRRHRRAIRRRTIRRRY